MGMKVGMVTPEPGDEPSSPLRRRAFAVEGRDLLDSSPGPTGRPVPCSAGRPQPPPWR